MACGAQHRLRVIFGVEEAVWGNMLPPCRFRGSSWDWGGAGGGVYTTRRLRVVFGVLRRIGRVLEVACGVQAASCRFRLRSRDREGVRGGAWRETPPWVVGDVAGNKDGVG